MDQDEENGADESQEEDETVAGGGVSGPVAAESPEERKLQEYVKQGLSEPIARQLSRLLDKEAAEKLKAAGIPEDEIKRILEEGGTKPKDDRRRIKKRAHLFMGETVLNEMDLFLNRWPGRTLPILTMLKVLIQYAIGELPSSDILRLASDRATRREIELKDLPDIVYKWLSRDRAYVRALFFPLEGLPEGYEPLVENDTEGKTKKLYGPAAGKGLVPAERKQRQYIVDGSKTETGGGREVQVTYFLRWNRVRYLWRRSLRRRGFKDRLAATVGDLSPEEQFIWVVEFHQARREAAREMHDFINGWNAYLQFERIVKEAQEQGIPVKEHPKYEVYRLVSFNTIERWDHWREAVRRAEAIPEAREDIHIFGGEGTQSLAESIDARTALYDMGSAILAYPNFWVEEIPDIDEEDEKGIRAFIVHSEKTVYERGYGQGHWRKTQDHRKEYLSLEGAAALGMLRKDDAVKARDKWLFGSIPDMLLGDLMVHGMDNRIILMCLADQPPDYEIPDGPRLAGETVEVWGEHNEAINFLRWWMIRTTRGEEILRKRELTERVKLVNYNRDQIFWAYVSGERGKEEIHFEPGLGRKPVAVPKHLLSLPTNLLWMLLYMSFAIEDLVNGTNNIAEDCGYDIRMTCDGPDSNLFRTLDIGYEIWRTQPDNSIIQELKRVWNSEVAKGTTHIRPVYYREIIAELPQERLANLPTPDKEYVQTFRDATAAQLAAATDPEEKRKLEKDLALLNRCLKRDAKDLDPLTRFVQKLNRDSDDRVRMWAGFEAHGKEGGIMAFEPPEAVGYVKENYGADTGGPYEDLQAIPMDLIMFAWTNLQFHKAFYLARGLSYQIATKVSPMERHKAVAHAVISGLNPAIANHIAEGFKGLERYVMPLGESAAAKYVQGIFEQKEIEQLGREIIKKLLPKNLLRKEMRLQILP